MAKVSLRIPLHKNHPDKFLKNMREVVKRHETLGAGSPLNNPSLIDMVDFKAKLEKAEELRNKSIEARADAEAFMGQAKEIMGTMIGHSINTEGTLYFMLDKIKRILLVKYAGMEETLEQFGFHVVKGLTNKVGRKRKK